MASQLTKPLNAPPPTQIEPYEGLYKPLVSLNKGLIHNHELDTWGKGSQLTSHENMATRDPETGRKPVENKMPFLGGGFKDFLFSSLPGGMIQFNYYFSRL